MKYMCKLIFLVLFSKWGSCTITGLTYMDSMEQKNLNDNGKSSRSNPPREVDPCNPLYWYPRPIPEECFIEKSTREPPPSSEPLSVPIPVPVPPPVPMPFPAPVSVPIPPIPYGIPIQPTNPMVPLAVPPYPLPYPASYLPAFALQSFAPLFSPQPPAPKPNAPHPFVLQPFAPQHFAPQFAVQPLAPQQFLPQQRFELQNYKRSSQTGFVPGIPGLVSPDGGINILPFTDVYADMLEKHKQKMISKEMARIIAKYDNKYKKFKRHGKH